jgi:hypothetical protein
VPVNIIESKQIFTDILLPINSRNNNAPEVNNQNSSRGLLGANFGHNFSQSSQVSSDKLNVYFYRYIGYDNKEEHIKRLNELNQRLTAFESICLRLNGKIPQPYNMALTDKLGRIFDKVSEIDIRSESLDSILESAGTFLITKDDKINQAFKHGFSIIMKQYTVNEPVPNLSIEKNFIIKLILWASEYIPKLFNTKIDMHVPKVVYLGTLKKHEAYFLILLSQIGCDVLYINSENDGDYHKIDKYNTFSKLQEFPVKAPIDYAFMDVNYKTSSLNTSNMGNYQQNTTTVGAGGTAAATATSSAQAPPAQTHNTLQANDFRGNSGAKLVDRDRIIITLKKAVNIFEDITFPLSKRVGYIGLPSPVLPVYFYRHLGMEEKDLVSEDEYYNKIFSLDKKLAEFGYGYVRFIDHIPAPENQEIDMITRRYVDVFGSGGGNLDPKLILKKIKSIGVLANNKNLLLDNLINDAFEKVVIIYLSKEKTINQGRMQNFIYKLIVWVNRYFKKLKINKNYEESPKVLYYGDIKPHEVYFLIFLSSIGCDILYLATEESKDKPFLEIDPKEEYTNLTLNEKLLPMQEFPTKERVIRKTTTAFNASRELENIIFNEEVGLFKPWQFEAYITRPITLRTTYEELKILWKEDAKMRPEFKIQNGCVYVPNLFAKVGGTSESLEQYWQDYKYFSKQPNTCELRTVPFVNMQLSKQEIYSLAYLLNNKGLVDLEALQGSKYYKFGYLRTSLQNLLLAKLNELMTYEGFKRPIDNNFKLAILATVITLEDSLLKLIETFDYPWAIPKLVIYNSAKEAFSDEDSIIIAYLNSIGFDIVILTPTNYNTIEQKLKDEIFDKFQLPSIQYDLQVPTMIENVNEKGKSIFSRMFGK